MSKPPRNKAKPTPTEAPKAVVGSEFAFADTLRELMLEKRISASDLAREVWGSKTDGRGYEVAKNRDRIGHYLSGKSFPERENLTKIAKVLGVHPDRLMKAQPAPAVRKASRDPQDIQVVFFTEDKHGTGSVSLHNLELSTKTILALIDLINKDPVHASKKAKQYA